MEPSSFGDSVPGGAESRQPVYDAARHRCHFYTRVPSRSTTDARMRVYGRPVLNESRVRAEEERS